MDGSTLGRDIRLLQRAPILAACRDGPVERSTIADRAGSSRTTVYRATTELEAEGLLEKRAGGYALTNFGTTMLERLAHFQDELDGARHVKALLDRIDAPELRDNVGLFTDATVIEARPDAPYAIEQRLVSLVGAHTGEWFGFTRTFGSPAVVEAVSRAVLDGANAEWVFTSDAIAGLREQHSEAQAEMRALDRTATYVVERLPFDFAALGGTLALIATDSTTGVHAAMAITDNPAAVVWARELFETHRDRAERVA